jgi:uncharacterized Fe-S cluster-containing radical SAM superfamily enzyme
MYCICISTCIYCLVNKGQTSVKSKKSANPNNLIKKRQQKAAAKSKIILKFITKQLNHLKQSVNSET